jgi:hemerythrin-like domain-containing protein
MSRASTIDFRTPGAGFDQPLAMWLACHERVARMAGLLARLREHLDSHPVDQDAQASATSVRRYFDEAAPRHHDDEEVDLFPAVLRRLAAGSDPARLALVSAAVERLQREHEDMSRLWSALRVELARVECGEQPDFDPAVVAQFIDHYASHIELEETEIGSAARDLLTPADLAAIGQAMAARRGVDWDEIMGSGLAS